MHNLNLQKRICVALYSTKAFFIHLFPIYFALCADFIWKSIELAQCLVKFLCVWKCTQFEVNWIELNRCIVCSASYFVQLNSSKFCFALYKIHRVPCIAKRLFNNLFVCIQYMYCTQWGEKNRLLHSKLPCSNNNASKQTYQIYIIWCKWMCFVIANGRIYIACLLCNNKWMGKMRWRYTQIKKHTAKKELMISIRVADTHHTHSQREKEGERVQNITIINDNNVNG